MKDNDDQPGVTGEPRLPIAPPQASGKGAGDGGCRESALDFTGTTGRGALRLPAAGTVAFVRGVKITAVEVYGGAPFYVLS